MKTFLFSAVLLIISAINLQAQTADTTVVIKFASTVHDYGTIVQGADGNCEFKFVNEGKSPLVLSNVRASCGCTVPNWTREPILPGKEGVIKVAYNTNIVGTFSKAITVNSNAKNAEVMLTIKGNVTPKPAQ